MTNKNNSFIEIRTRNFNNNAFVIGSPGCGKTIIVKEHIEEILSTTEDQVFIVDAFGEYGQITQKYNGRILELNNGTGIEKGAFNISINSKDTFEDMDYLFRFSDRIASLLEIATSDNLTPEERFVLNKSVVKLAVSCIGQIKLGKENDTESFVTLKITPEELSASLRSQESDEGIKLSSQADLVAEYLSASLLDSSTFKESQITTLDCHRATSSMREFGTLSFLYQVSDQMKVNASKGKRTWVFIDGIYHSLKNEYSARFLTDFWRRSRKLGGFITGVTQDPDELVSNEYGRHILINTGCMLLLHQSLLNATQLGNILDLGKSNTSYLCDNRMPGEGLLKDGDHWKKYSHIYYPK